MAERAPLHLHRTMCPGEKSPVECARFLPGRTRLVASSGDGKIESWTIPVGRRQRENNRYHRRRAHPRSQSQLDDADGMDSETLCTSDLPHRRNDDLTMPTVGCVWKISGDMFVTGSYGKKMDG